MSVAYSLPGGNCRACGAPSGTPHAAAGHPGMTLLTREQMDDLLVHLKEYLASQRIWLRRSTAKRAFGMSVTTKPQQVPWTGGINHIGSIVQPLGTVYMGGDASVTATGGGSAGIQIVSGAAWVFGEEEGTSDTWLVAPTSTPVDVRCLELLGDADIPAIRQLPIPSQF